MAFQSLATFYIGLTLIVIGTGLLKGNAAVIVGALYGPQDSRRDAGFSIYYMGINLGAFIAPLVCGYLGQRVNWHVGFAAAGVGMVLGVVQYTLGAKYLGAAGLYPAPAESPAAAAALQARTRIWGIVALVAVVALIFAMYTGALPISATAVADAAATRWSQSWSSSSAGSSSPPTGHRRSGAGSTPSACCSSRR
jgi:POT family proton-dependent oligopeptide transporter